MATQGSPAPAPSPAPLGEKRRAARIKFQVVDNLEVLYKLLSHMEKYQSSEIFRGSVTNLSKGGALIEGPIPGPEWLPRLGEGRVLIGLNVMCPGYKPIKALATLRWTRPAAQNGRYEMGVQFEQIEQEHRANLERFLISHQIRTRKIQRRPLDGE